MISEEEAYRIARGSVLRMHTEPKEECRACKEVGLLAQKLMHLEEVRCEE